jgi:hypothetical protein
MICLFFLSKQPIASKALHVVFSYLLHMHKWLVNQAASEFQLWCRHEYNFRAVSANSDSNHPKFSKQNDTDGSMSIKQGHCSVKKGKR